MLRSILMAGVGVAWLAVAAPAAAESPEVSAGGRLAQRYCGGCHAVAAGPGRSPLADAPPFRELYKRYGPGGLAGLLAEGMLTPDPSLEEGVLPGHPRMPMVALGVDERAALKAYLESLEPGRQAAEHPAGFDRDQGAAPATDHSDARRAIP